MSGDRSLPSGSSVSRDGPTTQRVEPAAAPAAWSVLDKKRPTSQDRHALDAQAVVDRAKASTKETLISEQYAPGKSLVPQRMSFEC